MTVISFDSSGVFPRAKTSSRCGETVVGNADISETRPEYENRYGAPPEETAPEPIAKIFRVTPALYSSISKTSCRALVSQLHSMPLVLQPFVLFPTIPPNCFQRPLKKHVQSFFQINAFVHDPQVGPRHDELPPCMTLAEYQVGHELIVEGWRRLRRKSSTHPREREWATKHYGEMLIRGRGESSRLYLAQEYQRLAVISRSSCLIRFSLFGKQPSVSSILTPIRRLLSMSSVKLHSCARAFAQRGVTYHGSYGYLFGGRMIVLRHDD